MQTRQRGGAEKQNDSAVARMCHLCKHYTFSVWYDDLARYITCSLCPVFAPRYFQRFKINERLHMSVFSIGCASPSDVHFLSHQTLGHFRHLLKASTCPVVFISISSAVAVCIQQIQTFSDSWFCLKWRNKIQQPACQAKVARQASSDMHCAVTGIVSPAQSGS